MAIYLTKQEAKVSGKKNAQTLKEKYGLSHEQIVKKGFANKLWIRYTGSENIKHHNMRSVFSKKHPIQLHQNKWFELTHDTRAWGIQGGKRKYILEKEWIHDFEFWLRYPKVDFDISLEEPKMIDIDYDVDKNYSIDNVNVYRNVHNLTKKRICEEIEERFSITLDPKSHKKEELLEEFKNFVSNELERGNVL